jgi:hypothetical protein
MVMPTFLVMGASKAGTTAFHLYLSQHPEIFMSSFKEPKFFAFEGMEPAFLGPGKKPDQQAPFKPLLVTSLSKYQELFSDVTEQKAIGESSPQYLYSERAPERMRHYVPEVKLILILREPVERAYAHFLYNILENREPITDFGRALAEEENRIHNNWWWAWHYKYRGLYFQQVKRYLDVFSRDQMKIYLYDDLKKDAVSMLQDTFKFIGVDDTFLPNVSVKHNASGIPKNQELHKLLTRPNPVKTLLKTVLPDDLATQVKTYFKNKNLGKPELSPEVRKQLAAEYREDILQLQDLIQQDLSSWLKVGQ